MRLIKVNKKPAKKTYKIAKRIGIGALVVGLFVTALSFKVLYIGDEPAKPTDNIIKKALLSGVKTTPTPIPTLTRFNNSDRGIERLMFEYDLTKLTCSAHVARIIREQSNRVAEEKYAKEFFETVYCIVGYESNFNPTCTTITSREHSIGLLQINTYSNYPKSWDKNKLKDPAFNLQYQLPELYDWFLNGKKKGLSGELLTQHTARFGQRPDWSSSKVRNYIIKTISKYRIEIESARIK